MKDLPLFLLKNAFGVKMKKGFCSGEGSTSIMEQRNLGSTLDDMILGLEMEEPIGRRRMSSVNSSDILRSAKNALNQYPRFSLDGRDAMYRVSFTAPARPGELPAVVGGERVVWCKPGVVAKLMGLEAIPVPLSPNGRHRREKLAAKIRRQNLRRRSEAKEMQRRRGKVMPSCRNGRVPPLPEFYSPDCHVGWPMGRFG